MMKRLKGKLPGLGYWLIRILQNKIINLIALIAVCSSARWTHSLVFWCLLSANIGYCYFLFLILLSIFSNICFSQYYIERLKWREIHIHVYQIITKREKGVCNSSYCRPNTLKEWSIEILASIRLLELLVNVPVTK